MIYFDTLPIISHFVPYVQLTQKIPVLRMNTAARGSSYLPEYHPFTQTVKKFASTQGQQQGQPFACAGADDGQTGGDQKDAAGKQDGITVFRSSSGKEDHNLGDDDHHSQLG